jgi:hypothetical protein
VRAMPYCSAIATNVAAYPCLLLGRYFGAVRESNSNAE